MKSQSKNQNENQSALTTINYIHDNIKQDSMQFLYKLKLVSKLTHLKHRETVEERYQSIKNASTGESKRH